MIPLLDLKHLNSEMQASIEGAATRVMRSGRYILGPEVEAFESEWAAYCGVNHCVGTGNALDALRIILMAYEIGEGDEVIVPSNTYIATWLAVSLVGATPVPVEPDPNTFTLDPRRIAAALTPRTRAIMPVHLYGRCADMDPINAIAAAEGLRVIADAAQAHGALYRGKRAGGLCDAEAFSFYPSKNLGAMGDGGAITTNDAALASIARRLRNYGGIGRLDHTRKGINSRLDEMQAAILRAKLPFLDSLNLRRRLCADWYGLRLAYLPGLIVPPPSADSAWHQFVLRVYNRSALIEALARRQVEAHIHYPVPPHLEGAYWGVFKQGDFPIAEQLGATVLSLPIGSVNLEHEAAAVVAAVRDAMTEVWNG